MTDSDALAMIHAICTFLNYQVCHSGRQIAVLFILKQICHHNKSISVSVWKIYSNLREIWGVGGWGAKKVLLVKKKLIKKHRAMLMMMPVRGFYNTLAVL